MSLFSGRELIFGPEADLTVSLDDDGEEALLDVTDGDKRTTVRLDESSRRTLINDLERHYEDEQ